MQFSVLATAFSMASAVMGAPLIGSLVGSPVNTTTGVAKGAVGTVTAVAGSLPVVGEVVTIVDNLKGQVDLDLTVIAGLTDAVEIDAKLQLLVGSIQNATTLVTPLLSGALDGASGLTEGDLTVVLGLVTELQTITDEVKGTVTTLAGSLTADVLKTLQPTLVTVQTTLGGLLTPVLSLVFGVVGLVQGLGLTTLVDQLLSTAGGLNSLLPTLLAPVTSILGGVVGGVLGGGVLGGVL